MTEIEYENCACGGRRPKGTAPLPECGALPPEPDFERKTGYTAGPLMELENELIGPDEMEKLHKALPWVRSLVYGLIKRIYQHRTARSTIQPRAFAIMPPGVLTRLRRAVDGYEQITYLGDLQFLHSLLDELTLTTGTTVSASGARP